MSEEEIIEYFKEVISWYRDNTPDRIYALNNKDIEMIQGLLDLYKQEKEKNRQSKMRIVQLENEISARIEDVNRYFISTDKVRKLQDKIHQKLDTNGITRAYQISIDEDFRELLEEEQ